MPEGRTTHRHHLVIKYERRGFPTILRCVHQNKLLDVKKKKPVLWFRPDVLSSLLVADRVSAVWLLCRSVAGLGKVLGGLYSLCNTKSESDSGPAAAVRMIWGSAAQDVGGLRQHSAKHPTK